MRVAGRQQPNLRRPLHCLRALGPPAAFGSARCAKVKRGAAILMFIRSAFLAIAVALPAMCAGVQLEAGAAPVSVEADGGWLVSFSILNRGDVAAREVEVSAVSIDGANVLTPRS